MRILVKTSYACLFFVLLSACANVNQGLENLAVGDDNLACAGAVIQPPAGMVEVKDAELLQTAKGDPGKGKLCTGKVFMVQMPVAVYRVWDSTRPYSTYGNWWSLAYPQGSRDSYREAEDICPEWSGLDRISVCNIKVGTRVAIGPGQSVNCDQGIRYAPSPENQVYIPNDGQKNQIFVENCSNGAKWPGASQ